MNIKIFDWVQTVADPKVYGQVDAVSCFYPDGSQLFRVSGAHWFEAKYLITTH